MRVDDAEASVVVRHSSGREGTAVLPVSQLAASGIHAGDDFQLTIAGEGAEAVMTLTLAPPRELTKAEIGYIRAQAEALAEALSCREETR